MLYALITIVAVLLLHVPCATAFAQQAQPEHLIPLAPHAAQTMSCCSTKTSVQSPALCCSVHAEPAMASAPHTTLPDLELSGLMRVPAAWQCAALPADVRALISLPPPPLHAILRI